MGARVHLALNCWHLPLPTSVCAKSSTYLRLLTRYCPFSNLWVRYGTSNFHLFDTGGSLLADYSGPSREIFLYSLDMIPVTAVGRG